MSNAPNRRGLSLLETVASEDAASNEAVRRRHRGAVLADADAGNAASVGDARSPGGRDESQAVPESLRETSFPADDVEAAPQDLVLPQRQDRRPWGGIVSFVLCVLLPTLGAAIYYIGFASNQYAVEWRYAVRDTSTATSTSSATSSLTALLGVSTAASGPDNYMVTEYIKSRQAVDDLEKRIGVISLYSRPTIDAWSRFDASLPVENFVSYWKNMVTASFDAITGTALAEVRAFSEEDAYLIAKTLVALCEDLVNEVAQRPQMETVRYAEAEVARAEARLKQIRAEIAAYRNKESVIDPTSSVVLSNATLAANLRSLLTQYQTDLAAIMKGGVGPNASQVQSLRTRIKATQDQLKDVETEVSKARLGDNPLSEVVGRYEQLTLELQFAQNMMTSTVQSLEQARSSAMARRIFITPYVHPAKPHSSTYPNRVVAIFIVAGLCTLLWTVALLLGRSIREHLA